MPKKNLSTGGQRFHCDSIRTGNGKRDNREARYIFALFPFFTHTAGGGFPLAERGGFEPCQTMGASKPEPPPDQPIEASPPSANYAVGWGRPPVHARFKPGNNANPNGRPRKKLRTLRDVLLQPTAVTIGRREEVMPLIDILLIRAKSRALNGDRRALEYLIDLTGSKNLAKEIIKALE